MKKRLLFILIVFIAWLPCYSKTGIYVLSACVVRDLYLHGLPTSYASWAEAGLHDSGIPYRHPSPIDSSISLASGRLVEEGIEGYFLIMGILVSAIFSVDVALYSFGDSGWTLLYSSTCNRPPMRWRVFRWECSLSNYWYSWHMR